MIVRLRLKARPLTQWDIGRELRRRIKKTFDAQGIQLSGAARHDHADPGSAGAGHRRAGADPRADRRQHDALICARPRRGFAHTIAPMDTHRRAPARASPASSSAASASSSPSPARRLTLRARHRRRRHARMEALPSPITPCLTDSPPGREVLVEGRIARDQPVPVPRLRRLRQGGGAARQAGTTNAAGVEGAWTPCAAAPHRATGDDASVRVVNASYGMCWARRRVGTIRSKIIDTHYSGLVAGEGRLRPRPDGGRRPRGDRGRLGHARLLPGRGSPATSASPGGSASASWRLGTLMIVIAAVLFVTAVAEGAARPPVPWPPEPGAAR